MKKTLMDRVFDLLSEESRRHARIQSGERRPASMKEKDEVSPERFEAPGRREDERSHRMMVA